MNVKVLPAATTRDGAIKDALKQVAALDDSQITDGEPIAGQATRAASVDAEVQGDAGRRGRLRVLDAIRDIRHLVRGPAADRRHRRGSYPQVLTTITVDPAP